MYGKDEQWYGRKISPGTRRIRKFILWGYPASPTFCDKCGQGLHQDKMIVEVCKGEEGIEPLKETARAVYKNGTWKLLVIRGAGRISPIWQISGKGEYFWGWNLNREGFHAYNDYLQELRLLDPAYGFRRGKG